MIAPASVSVRRSMRRNSFGEDEQSARACLLEEIRRGVTGLFATTARRATTTRSADAACWELCRQRPLGATLAAGTRGARKRAWPGLQRQDVAPRGHTRSEPARPEN